jgi:hypothetical protein
LQEEFTLLDDPDTLQDDAQNPGGPDHELYTSPILTREAYLAIDGKQTIGQYGVLGKILGIGSVGEAFCQRFHVDILIQLEERYSNTRRSKIIPEYCE